MADSNLPQLSDPYSQSEVGTCEQQIQILREAFRALELKANRRKPVTARSQLMLQRRTAANSGQFRTFHEYGQLVLPFHEWLPKAALKQIRLETIMKKSGEAARLLRQLNALRTATGLKSPDIRVRA